MPKIKKAEKCRKAKRLKKPKYKGLKNAEVARATSRPA